MELQALITFILEQWTIWAPSLVSIVGIVCGILGYGAKIKAALNEVKGATIELKDEKTMKELMNQLQASQSENAELRKQVKQVMEQLTRIKGPQEESKNESTTVGTDKKV